MTGNHRQGLRPLLHRYTSHRLQILAKVVTETARDNCPPEPPPGIPKNTELHFRQQTLEVKEFKFDITRQRLKSIHRFIESRSHPRLATKLQIRPSCSASTS
ncbi:Uncharacterized protein Rs2_39239 [Raphanus sativus]|nr:Uncharacterized protein Rs2_39239 [Raphanus sativus]